MPGAFKKILFTAAALSAAFCPGYSSADTIYLKNGRAMDGFVVEQGRQNVIVDVGFGRVGLKLSEIDHIVISDERDAARLRAKWARQQETSRQRLQEQKLKEELAPKHVEINEERGQIVVEALLDHKITVHLILDTGASLTVIKDSVARQLGIDTSALKSEVKLSLADGRESQAKHAVLSSVSVQGVEARNVDVAILPADARDTALQDGLLGMTYLKNFSFKIDQKNKKLTLEKTQ